MSIYIHPTAIVEEGAIIGDGSYIWHFVHIRAGSIIGKNVSLGKNCYVDDRVIIGDGCRIQNNVSLYRGVVLEEDVFVGPLAVFTNDPYPRAQSEWTPDVATPTLVKKGASICAGASIRCGLTLGEYCTIGMGAVLTKNTGPYELWLGHPATCKGKVDINGKPVYGG